MWLLSVWHWLAMPIGDVPFAHAWMLAGWFSLAVNFLPKSTRFDKWPRFKAYYELFVKLCSFLALNIRKRLPTLGIKIPGLGFDPNYSHADEPAVVTPTTCFSLAQPENNVNALAILMMILQLAPKVVNTIEVVHGQAVSGADKKTMAQTALAGAVDGAVSAFGGNTTNGVLSQVAGALVGTVIDQAVKDNKANGTYQAARDASLNLDANGKPALPAPTPAQTPAPTGTAANA